MRRKRTVKLSDGRTLTRQTAQSAPYSEARVAGVWLNENPNRSKRKGRSAVDRNQLVTDAVRFARTGVRIERDASGELHRTHTHRPLTVSAPTLDRIGRKAPRSRTSYTI